VPDPGVPRSQDRPSDLNPQTSGHGTRRPLASAGSSPASTTARALASARRNFALNGFDPNQHEFLGEDCFAALENFYQMGRRFDLIIVDPPSFARNKAQTEAALQAYRRLNTLALRCLSPDGILASSSCTSQVSPTAFKKMLGEAASAAKRRCRIIHEAGHPLDHPVLAAFPESRYLKFVLATAPPRY
jgi:23S rRNA (cytosine1962-C5)-methyltransferase